MVNMARVEGGMPELVPDDSAKLLKKMVINKDEVNNAVELLQSVMKSDVNYVKLYEALKVRIQRAAATREVHEEKGEEWLKADELELKATSKADEAAALNAALDRKGMVHMRLIVEHKPHAKDDQVAPKESSSSSN